jgi:outer membrane protein OmpA-like peptidoglycan-associated protein/Tfp pilus assembly protein PilF
MKSNKILILIVLLLIVVNGFAQSQKKYSISNKRAISHYEQALRFFNRYDNITAKKLLQESIDIEPKFLEAYMVLSQVYMEMGEIDKAIETIKKSHEIDKNFHPRSFYILGILYFSQGEYKNALESFETFLTFNDKRKSINKSARKKIEECKFALNQIANPVPFEPKEVGDGVNTDLDEYWPSLSVDEKTLVYTVRLPKNPDKGIRGTRWQEDLYISYRNEDGEWSKGIPVSSPLNTDFNEGAQAVSSDGKTIYFTICRGVCNIYQSVLQPDGQWSRPQKLSVHVNTNRYSEKQPSISPDGKTLYFVSNRPGGQGDFDIWKCDKNPDGQWDNAVNLGSVINTSGSEQSPFIHFDNQTLYFSSSGHIGMGSQDIFVSRRDSTGGWSKPVNLGYPINTYRSEEGLIVNAKGTEAYYSSDIRPERGRDIYTFELYPAIRPTPTSYVKGTISDSKTLNPVEANVKLVDLKRNKVLMDVVKAKGGKFLVCLPVNNKYGLFVSSPGYLFHSEHFDLSNYYSFDKPFRLDVELQPIEKGEVLTLRNIFFAFDSYEILPESNAELNYLLDVLKQNPNIRVEVSGHTDNLGSDDYNLKLSSQRAKAVVDYLIQHGIESERLEWVGFGESKPVAPNTTEEGRALNRRTEVRIL